MVTRPSPIRDERGYALVLALMVLLTLGLVSTVLMASINSNRKMAGHDVRESRALNLAEAGVGEAIARLRNGDVTLPSGNPRAVAQIFLTNAGSVPVPATSDTAAMQTLQPAGEWLAYSTPGKGPDVLTVEFRTNAARSAIYRYDQSLTPPVNTASGFPIYRITSTGRVGTARRRVQTEVVTRPIDADINAAIMANVGIDFKGNTDICGHDHSVDTPAGTKGRGPCLGWESGPNPLPGAWSTADITKTGSANLEGVPSGEVDMQTGFFQGPWEPLGMTQAAFFSWMGAAQGTAPNPPRGIIYLDDNATTQDQSGVFAYHGGNGEGFLYVDGDLTVNGNFTFKGLIYVEGNLHINGTCWILGGMVVRGKTRIDIANGNCCILYSSETITKKLSEFGGDYVTLAWREIPL